VRSGPGGLTHRRRRTDRNELTDLAASVDLLAVAVSGGYSLHGAVRVAGTEGEGPVASALGRVAADLDRGVPLADGLAALPRELGPGVAALSTTLSIAAVSGTPLGPALQRLADAERRRYRRAVEARARRLPVLLLGPLVGLVLPAFVVLTIVPAALSSVVSRPLPDTSLPPTHSPVAAVAPGP
jgi:tight adherence protein C